MNFVLQKSMFNRFQTLVEVDDSIFFTFTTENGLRIVCESAEEFKAIFLEDYDGIYKVKKINSICFGIPSDCCEGIALPLCERKDISQITGFIILVVVAKEWIQSTEPRYEIPRKDMNFQVGKGNIFTANMNIKDMSIAFTTDTESVFRTLAKNKQPVIYVANNDFGFHLLSQQLDKAIHKVMIGMDEPKENKHLFVSIFEIHGNSSLDQYEQNILNQVTFLKNKVDEYK